MKNIAILDRECNGIYENDFYFNAVLKFKANPIMITEVNLEKLRICTGILVTGGVEKEKLDDIFIKYALDHDLPLFGICQGMQSMAIYNSDLKIIDIGNDSHYNDEKYSHLVYIEESNLKNIIKKDIICVNSHHLQTVIDSALFNIVGRSEDGLIEAIENPSHPFQIGVQWHPERMLNYDDVSNILFKKFIETVKEKDKGE